MEDTKDTKLVIIFSRLLRWAFGALFITLGIVFYDDSGWLAIFFGVVFLVTGFFRPKRCLEEGCKISATKENSSADKV